MEVSRVVKDKEKVYWYESACLSKREDRPRQSEVNRSEILHLNFDLRPYPPSPPTQKKKKIPKQYINKLIHLKI